MKDFDHRILKTAIHQARKSRLRYKHGAVLFTKSGEIVSVAHNTSFWHAESHLLSKIPKYLKPWNLQILVVRVNGFGELAISKPCSQCRKKIIRSQIRRVFYSLNEETLGG